MTRTLMRMADRLRVLGVTRVVREPTTDYWKPAFYPLEAGRAETGRNGRVSRGELWGST
jgi:hypothetical protein